MRTIEDKLLIEAEKRMKQSVENTWHELGTIRTGRASIALLDKIYINYYGTKTPLKHIASISIPEPRVMVISPYEPKFLKEIEKQILTSDLGITPTNDGKVIRLVIPQLNEERRKELVRLVKKIAEDGRIAIRNIRRDTNEEYRKMEAKSEITKDDLINFQEKVQKITDKYIEEIDKYLAQKEKEIMEV